MNTSERTILIVLLLLLCAALGMADHVYARIQTEQFNQMENQ